MGLDEGGLSLNQKYSLLAWRWVPLSNGEDVIQEIILYNPISRVQVHAFRDGNSEHYHLHDENRDQTQVIQDFGRVWTILCEKIGGSFVVVESDEAASKLERIVEEFGYASLDVAQWIDFGSLVRIVVPTLSRRLVFDAAAFYGLMGGAIDDPSTLPLYDLIRLYEQTCARLFQGLFDLPLITLQTIALAPSLSNSLRQIMQDAITYLFSNASQASDKPIKVLFDLAFLEAAKVAENAIQRDNNPVQEDFVATTVKLLRHSLQGITNFAFERRIGQEQMAKKVAQAFAASRLLVVEAGTGTGKSLGYLLPAISYAVQTGQRVVVATHTVALQEQLQTQDIEIAKKALPFSFSSTILKGRNNYVCLRKVAQKAQALPVLLNEEANFIVAVLSWLTQSSTGDREELAMEGRETEWWRTIQSETESCLGKRCPFFHDCYFFVARQRALSSDILITNHSLVLSDIMADHRVLPPHKHVILDEAHHLEEQATKNLGAEAKEEELRRFMDRLVQTRTSHLPELEAMLAASIVQGKAEWQPYLTVAQKAYRTVLDLAKESKSLFQAIHRFLEGRANRPEVRITKLLLEEDRYASVLDCAQRVQQANQILSTVIKEYERLIEEIERSDTMAGRMEDVFGLVRHIANGFTVVLDVTLLTQSEDEFVGWLTKWTRKSGVSASFHLAPLSVGGILRSSLYDKRDSVIFTSATLTVDRSFTYFLSQVGLLPLMTEGKVDDLIVSSPFLYDRQAILCMPNDLPKVNDPSFSEAVGHAIRSIAVKAKGRTLVLFTSYQMLEMVYQKQHQPFLQQGIRLLAQGHDDHRRSRLIETFRRTNRAVLFGVNSFWEGIDIKGEDLSCIVIVKLPFDVPTNPIVEARTERLKQQGRHPFMDYSVPQAVIRFTQGFGRLIRSSQDRGAVFVLDNRIFQASYGKLFLRSLPRLSQHIGSLEDSVQQADAYF